MPKKFHKNRPRNKNKKSDEPIWVYGLHAVKACFDMQSENIVEVLCARDNEEYNELTNDMRSMGLQVQTVDNDKIARAVGESSRHQSIAVRLKSDRVYSEKDLLAIIQTCHDQQQTILLLILDGVTDPRNLGACLRSANGAGVDAVIVPKDNASSITSVTRKTASGAAETTPFIQVTNLARTMRDIQDKGVWVIGTSDSAEQSIYQQDLKKDVAIVLGAEDKGIRALTAKTCDQLVSIPMSGAVSSLNVSVATAVCLYEVLRQKILP